MLVIKVTRKSLISPTLPAGVLITKPIIDTAPNIASKKTTKRFLRKSVRLELGAAIKFFPRARFPYASSLIYTLHVRAKLKAKSEFIYLPDALFALAIPFPSTFDHNNCGILISF